MITKDENCDKFDRIKYNLEDYNYKYYARTK